MKHERFHIKAPEELQEQAAALNLDIPVQEDLSPLFEKRRVGTRITPNAMAVLPIEGGRLRRQRLSRRGNDTAIPSLCGRRCGAYLVGSLCGGAGRTGKSQPHDVDKR